MARRGARGRTSTPRRWLRRSNPARPWYAPIPECPTPPKGSWGTAICRTIPFTHTPPERVRAITSRTVRTARGEDVEGERIGSRGDPAHRVLQIVHGDDRQDRAEDLLRHERRVPRRVTHDRRRDITGRRVRLSPNDELAAVGLEQPGEPCELTVVDDTRVVPARPGVGPVERGDRSAERVENGSAIPRSTST